VDGTSIAAYCFAGLAQSHQNRFADGYESSLGGRASNDDRVADLTVVSEESDRETHRPAGVSTLE
jgi:hypothetical protein